MKVDIYEMRPEKMTKAHKSGNCAELVCSNSFRGAALSNAVGLLKEELKLCKSLVMEAALVAEVPAGGALAVDRDVFSEYVDQKLKNHPDVTFHSLCVNELPPFSREEPLIVATGPLTDNVLAEHIQKFLGADSLAFFDAISPIMHVDSINMDVCFRQSRYDKGEEQYYQFISDVEAADKYTGNEDVENDSPEKLRPFEGCMPIEDMVERGKETLRFGPWKPVGLSDSRTGEKSYAVMQLRQDDKAGTLWSMVGMQTRMKRADQERVFRSLPALEKAEFLRYGSVHRNTFIDSPKCLYPTLEAREHPGLFFAGQITGTEGYVESTAGGLLAGINAARVASGVEPLSLPVDTGIGSLFHYISDPERKDFQPMNINFGLMESYSKIPKRDANRKRVSRKDRRETASRRALALLETELEQLSCLREVSERDNANGSVQATS
ncbi:UNVERIFIED_CONTAM: hypothetical protein GTU68_067107 [Idotea baltica]|nr:hypothetical protein [Idotea baltica]